MCLSNNLNSLILYKKDLVFNFICSNITFFKFKDNFWLILYFVGPLGNQSIFLSLTKQLIIKSSLDNKNLTSFLISYRMLKQLFLSVRKTLIGICCGYFTKFNLIGYNYKFKSSLRFCYLILFLGHCFSILIKLPKTIKIFKKKRSFIVFSTNLLDFNFTTNYLRHMRDLYPYKTRGLSIDNEKVLTKKGKKLKIR